MNLNRSAVLENGKKVLTMAKEYIEREAAIEELKRRDFLPVIVKHAIEAVPAADVAPVVRCKDCLYSRERYGHLECIHGVSYRNTWNKPDFFCSYGERKEGAD